MRTCSKILIASLLLIGTACGDDPAESAKETVSNAAANVSTNVDPSSIKERVEAEVVDRLDCSGYVREETRDSVAATLEGRDLEGLLAEPTKLARAVGAAALTTDTTVLLVGNISRLASQGHLQTAMGGQWDSLSCGDAPTEETCSDLLSGGDAGTIATSVVCEGDAVTAVRAQFDGGCKLFGTENSGAVNFERGNGVLSFEQFKLGSVNEVSGRMIVEVAEGEVNRLGLDTGTPIEIASNVGKSCEERLIMRSFEAIDTAANYSLDFDIERIVGEDTLRVRTVQGPASWGKPVDCSCPTTGSTVELTMTDPVGLGKEGIVQFAYGSASGDVCSESTAQILTWPDGCEGDDTCGRTVAEDLLGALVTTSCLSK